MDRPPHPAEPVDGGLPGPGGHGDRRRRGCVPWLTVLGWLFLTFNSGLAIYHCKDDYTSIAFVAFSYSDLLLLFSYLRWYNERAPAQSRTLMKVAVWSLTTLLTGMFSYKVAAVMPLPVAAVVWAMAGVAALGFYAFFVRQEELADVD